MQIAEYARNYAFEADYWWFVGRRKLVLETLLPLVHGQSKARLLDIGCGTGYTLGVMARHSEAYGLDVAIEGLAFCLGRGLGRLVQAEAEHLPFADESMDVVTALDVLEHLDDDDAALREWRRVCRPGGHLLIYVPALQSLWSGEDYVSQHRRRYRRAQLGRRVREAGFSIQKLTYANTALLPAVVATVLCNRLFNRQALYRSNLKPLPKWLNRTLTFIFSTEARCLTRLDSPVGSSLLCLAQKPPSTVATSAHAEQGV